MRRTALAALTTALVLLGLLAVPASAYEYRGSALYARFGPSATAGQGLVVIDRTDGSQPRIHGTFVGLAGHGNQTIVFRSIGCGGSPSAANRVLKVNGTANGSGELSYSGSIPAAADYSSVVSAWSTAGVHATCAAVQHVVRITEGAPTAWSYLGIVKTGPGTLSLLAESRSTDHLRLTVVVNGLSGDAAVQLRFTNVPCGHAATSASVLYSDTFPAALKTGTISVPFTALRNVMALRVTNTGTGFTNCAPAVFMANTEA